MNWKKIIIEKCYQPLMQLPENICTVTNKMAWQEVRSQRTVSLKGSIKACHEELLAGSQSVSL